MPTFADLRRERANGRFSTVYNILRAQRDIGGQSRIGAAYTDRAVGGDYNRLADVDGRILFDKLYTGSFQYATTRPGTYHVAGELVRKGADLARICDEVYQSYPLSRARLLRHVYSHFRLTHHNKIAYFWLRKADFARSGADSCDSEGLIDHIRAIAPVVVACVFEELEPELTRISLRSKSEKINVNEIAAKFGGGGHPAAAGARIPGTPLSVQRQVIAAIKTALNGAH